MQGLGVNPSWEATPANHRPELPERHVSRPGLSSRLRGSHRRLNLLCAPAGYGKTVLLCEALGKVEAGDVPLWLFLGGRSLSLTELCQQLLDALGLSASPATAPSTLLRFFSSTGAPLRLVLDDLPGDLSIELNHWFELLLGLPHSRLQLSVSCRQRPSWNLPRLLLQGELLELDAQALRLERVDFTQLCEGLDVTLSAERQDGIWRSSAGWWAGASLLLSHPTRGPALVGEYLAHELLPRLSDEERAVLFGLCHLPRFSAELCAQLWEGQGGAHLLQRLEQQQAFILPLPGQPNWYRLHPLVADVLQERLDPLELARLRLHSCRLLSVAGHLSDAIEQALRAEQPEVAATYMERLQPSWQLTDRDLHRLLEWRAQLPSQLLESTPRLVYLGTLSLIFSGRLNEAGACLQAFSRFLPAPDAGQQRRLLAHALALQGCLYAHRGQAQEAEDACREALTHLAVGEDDWLSVLLCYFTLARLLMVGSRQLEAQRLLLEGIERARGLGCLDSEALLQGDLMRLLLLRGELGQVEALLESNLCWREAAHIDTDPLLGRLLFVRGELLCAKGLAEEAEQSFIAGIEQASHCSAPFLLQGYVGLAEAASLAGRATRALGYLHQAERRMQYGRIDPLCYRAALDLQRLRIHGRQQDWGGVMELGQALIQEYPLGEALPLPLPPALAADGQWWLAEAERHQGRLRSAESRLRLLFRVCEDSGLRGLARNARQKLAELETTRGGLSESPGNEMPATRHASVTPLQEDLTPRESAVLALLANGLSNQEIADTLYLSVNTVKYHAKNINAKLGTSRRTQAIACAKHLGLLA